jgi:YggT family protein
MAYQEEPVRETVTTQRQVDTADQVRDQVGEERPVTPRDDHRMNVAERFIWLIAGIIMGLLALRFLLRLLGANPNNGFADFIYSVSHPFAVPFFGLFNYTADLGAGRFEFETLIAILIYALAAWVLAKLVTLGKR